MNIWITCILGLGLTIDSTCIYGIRTSFCSKIDAKNKPGAILIEKGTAEIRQTASQEWRLLRLLPFMIGKYYTTRESKAIQRRSWQYFFPQQYFSALSQIIFLFCVDDAVFVIINPNCRSKPTIYNYCQLPWLKNMKTSHKLSNLIISDLPEVR